MKFAAIAIAAVAVVSAGSAFAAERVADVDYLRASRCKGLATTLTGVVDAGSIDAYLKAARTGRQAAVYDRADAEYNKAKREARSEDRRARLTQELTEGCQAYVAGPSALATR